MAQEKERCARELLEVVPIVARFIRTEMRRHRALGLTVPQFHTLAFTERTGGTTLGGVAEHLGLTPPSTCKIVDGLEARELITRLQSSRDRRKVNLQITTVGKRAVADARRETHKSLAGILSSLDQREMERITQSMEALRTAFIGETVHANT
jgi:MarR family transcriptional regulator for hemolysin